MRFAQDAARTKPLRLETRHAGFDAEFFGEPVGGDHYAVAAPPAADPNGALLQLGIQRDFATGEEAVAVNVQDAIVGAHIALNNLARCRIPPRNKDEKIFRLGRHLSKASCNFWRAKTTVALGQGRNLLFSAMWIQVKAEGGQGKEAMKSCKVLHLL